MEKGLLRIAMEICTRVTSKATRNTGMESTDIKMGMYMKETTQGILKMVKENSYIAMEVSIKEKSKQEGIKAGASLKICRAIFTTGCLWPGIERVTDI